ncbi:hypothetical protein JL721_12692 [Aureococcus anophagefferens]|nr:hypothetical protein JL721_12692 [Aureococcus anophagefferens]
MDAHRNTARCVPPFGLYVQAAARHDSGDFDDAALLEHDIDIDGQDDPLRARRVALEEAGQHEAKIKAKMSEVEAELKKMKDSRKGKGSGNPGKEHSKKKRMLEGQLKELQEGNAADEDSDDGAEDEDEEIVTENPTYYKIPLGQRLWIDKVKKDVKGVQRPVELQACERKCSAPVEGEEKKEDKEFMKVFMKGYRKDTSAPEKFSWSGPVVCIDDAAGDARALAALRDVRRVAVDMGGAQPVGVSLVQIGVKDVGIEKIGVNFQGDITRLTKQYEGVEVKGEIIRLSDLANDTLKSQKRRWSLADLDDGDAEADSDAELDGDAEGRVLADGAAGSAGEDGGATDDSADDGEDDGADDGADDVGDHPTTTPGVLERDLTKV